MASGSIGAAARELGLSQPAVTHALAKLELILKMPLLRRGRDGSRGTRAGEILHRRVIRLWRHIAQGIAAARGEVEESDTVRQRRAALTSTQLACHLAVAGRGSFRAAAQSLAISEPALQRSVRELERLMGVALYRRDGQSIRVTPNGSALATRWQLALGEIAQAHDEIEAVLGCGAGRIALGCLPLMPKGTLAQALGQLLTRFPNVEISLEEGSYDQLSVALKSGRLDMLLGALRDHRKDEELVARALFDDPYVVIARREHPLAGRRRRPQPAELGRHSWVAPPRGTPRRAALDQLFDKLPARPSIVIETNSVAMMIATLSESDCLSLSSRSLAEIDYPAANLAVLPVPSLSIKRPVGVTTRANWLPTKVQQSLLDLL
jgi:molybdate transport repressor ModE-like protein